MCLVDDLMEPFRPFIDASVFVMLPISAETITAEDKRRLVSAMADKVSIAGREVVLASATQRAVFSFYQVCVDPSSPLVIDWHFSSQSG
jgi:CRISPR/Cas system-associated endonuclease Cas1